MNQCLNRIQLETCFETQHNMLHGLLTATKEGNEGWKKSQFLANFGIYMGSMRRCPDGCGFLWSTTFIRCFLMVYISQVWTEIGDPFLNDT